MTDAEALRSVVASTPDGCVVALLVVPRSGKSAIDGVVGGALRVRIAAPPVDGAANAAVVRFVADVFDLPKGRVRIVTGERSRHKRVALAGVTAEAAIARLAALLAPTAPG